MVGGAFGGVALLAACGAAPPVVGSATSTAVVVSTESVAVTATRVMATTAVAPTAAATSAKAAGTALRFTHFESKDRWQKITDAFVAKTGVNATYETVTGNYFTKLDTLVAGDVAPDVWGFQAKEVPPFAAHQALLALDQFVATSDRAKLKADTYASDWEQNTWAGKLYGQTFQSNPSVIFFSTDAFDKAQVPYPPQKWGDPSWTWNAFVDVYQKLTSGAGTNKVFAFNQNVWWVYYQPWIWSNGGSVLNQQMTKSTIAESASVDALQWMVDLQHKYHVMPLASDIPKGTNAAFGAGQLAMFNNIPALIPDLIIAAPHVKWNVAPYPSKNGKVVTRDPVDDIVAWSNTKRADMAWELIRFITGTDGQQLLLDYKQGFPALKSIAHSPAFLRPGDSVHWQLFVDAKDQGLARAEQVTPAFQKQDQLISKAEGPLWAGKSSVGDWAVQLAPQIDSLLQQQ